MIYVHVVARTGTQKPENVCNTKNIEILKSIKAWKLRLITQKSIDCHIFAKLTNYERNKSLQSYKIFANKFFKKVMY